MLPENGLDGGQRSRQELHVLSSRSFGFRRVSSNVAHWLTLIPDLLKRSVALYGTYVSALLSLHHFGFAHVRCYGCNRQRGPLLPKGSQTL